jgi:hypothetical protein
MAKWVAKGLNRVGRADGDVAQVGKIEDGPAFEWKNRGSMVFVGDYRVSLGVVITMLGGGGF